MTKKSKRDLKKIVGGVAAGNVDGSVGDDGADIVRKDAVVGVGLLRGTNRDAIKK